MGRCVVNPIWLVILLLYMSLLEGRRALGAMAANLRAKLPSYLRDGLVFWSVANFVNFRFMPVRHRLLFSGLAGACWSTWFSLLTKRLDLKMRQQKPPPVAPTEQGQLTLWGSGFFRSARVLWMLEELGLEYKHRDINIRTGSVEEKAEVLALNPRGKIPVLQDGELVLTESAAILCYLADRYGPTAAGAEALIPEPRTPARAVHDMWLYYLMTEVDAYALSVHRKHENLVELYGAAPAAVAAAKTHWERQLGIIAAELRARPGSDFLLGDRLTAVDIVLVDNVCSAAGYGWLPLAPHPQAEDGLTLLRYLWRLAKRPAFVRAQAKGAFDLAAVTELAGKAGQALEGQ